MHLDHRIHSAAGRAFQREIAFQRTDPRLNVSDSHSFLFDLRYVEPASVIAVIEPQHAVGKPAKR